MNKSPNQKLADLYVKRKAELLPLMEKAYGKPIPKDATHGFLVSLYVHLLKNNPEFANSVNILVNKYQNAVDPVTAIAEAIGKVAGAKQSSDQLKLQENQSKAESDKALYDMVLGSQQKSDTGKIILIAGISLLVVAGIVTVIVIKSKKK